MAGMLRWGGDVALLSVASNRNEPPAMLMKAAEARHLPGVLLDGEHAVADLYEVQVAPHAFVLDAGGILRYHGAVDNVTFSQRSPTRFPLEEAVEALLAGRQPELGEMPAFGCAIVREI